MAGAAQSDVPHGDDYWIDTDDVVDYARWLDRRVLELDTAWKRPDALARPDVQLWATSWIPWWYQWSVFRRQIVGNYVDRVNTWDDVKQRHAELLEHRAKAVSAGVDAPVIAPTPKDPTLGDLATSGGALGLSLGAGLLVGGVAVVALLLWVKR